MRQERLSEAHNSDYWHSIQGKICNLMQNIYNNSVAKTKLGTAVNKVDKNTIILLGNLFLISAAILPNTIPIIRANAIAVIPNFAEIGKDSARISLIERPFFREIPRSPVINPLSQLTNCIGNGSSRPSFIEGIYSCLIEGFFSVERTAWNDIHCKKCDSTYYKYCNDS